MAREGLARIPQDRQGGASSGDFTAEKRLVRP